MILKNDYFKSVYTLISLINILSHPLILQRLSFNVWRPTGAILLRFDEHCSNNPSPLTSHHQLTLRAGQPLIVMVGGNRWVAACNNRERGTKKVGKKWLGRTCRKKWRIKGKELVFSRFADTNLQNDLVKRKRSLGKG